MKNSVDKSLKVFKEKQLKSYLIVGLVAFAVYANSLLNSFVYDDEFLVLGDASITSVSNAPKFFTGKEGFNQVFARYYRPIVSLSYLIDYELWNFKPFGFHLTNVLLHVINSLLVFNLLMLIFHRREESVKNYEASFPALIGAFLFAVHPIHTEAVAWVSGRTDLLASAFIFAAFIFYIKFSRSVNRNERMTSLIMLSFFYVMSLLSKEVAIVLPLLLLLFDYLLEGKSLKDIFNEKKWIYTILILSSILYMVIRSNILEQMPGTEKYLYFYGKDFLTKLFTISLTIPLYLRLLILPIGLLYHYNGFLPYVNNALNPGVLISFSLTIILIGTAIYFFKRAPMITYLILFFFITLTPVLNLVPITNLAAERYLYVPSISMVFLVVFIGIQLNRTKYRNSYSAVTFGIILIFSVLTVIRNIDWKSNESLYFSAEGKQGTVVYVNIGYLYTLSNQYDKAEQYFRKALQINDQTVFANTNLGRVYILEGKYDSAYSYIMKAYNFDSLNPEPRFTLALLYVMSDKFSEAKKEIEDLQKIVPGYRNSNQILIQVNSRLQRDSIALISKDSSQTGELDKLKKARIDKLDKDSYLQYNQKNYEMAIKDLLELSEMNPTSRSVYFNNIGLCYLDQNNYDEAKKFFEQSIAASDNFSSAYLNLGKIYERMGDRDKAMMNYEKAVKSDPNNRAAKDGYERLKR